MPRVSGKGKARLGNEEVLQDDGNGEYGRGLNDNPDDPEGLDYLEERQRRPFIFRVLLALNVNHPPPREWPTREPCAAGRMERAAPLTGRCARLWSRGYGSV